MLLAGLGYCKTARRDAMTNEQKKQDYKPEPEEIVRWF